MKPRRRDISKDFESNRYARLPALLDETARAFYYTVVVAEARSGACGDGDHQVPGTPAMHGHPLTEKLLEEMLPTVEAATGLALYPTYSYFRVYRRGDELARHCDRPACEVSVSLCLGYAAPEPWPLVIESPTGVARVALEPGDGVVYRGAECPHWREPFAGEHAAQVFLHYVERDGPHSGLRYDGRRRLYERLPSRRTSSPGNRKKKPAPRATKSASCTSGRGQKPHGARSETVASTGPRQRRASAPGRPAGRASSRESGVPE